MKNLYVELDKSTSDMTVEDMPAYSKLRLYGPSGIWYFLWEADEYPEILIQPMVKRETSAKPGETANPEA